MKTSIYFSTIILSLLLVFSSCQSRPEEVKVKVITTTDLHAVIFPHDYIRDTILYAGMAYLKSYVDEQRAVDGQHVLLFDNGDLLQGQPTGYYYNFVADRPQNLFADVLNYLEFDAASVGNHDIETGPMVYNNLKDEFDFPWLAANVIDVETDQPYFTPYTIIEKQGVKIAVLGLVTSSVPDWLPYKLWEGMEFRDLEETASYWMNYIQENEQPHAVIGLFHSGGGEDTGYNAESSENAAVRVAKNIPGFDVIFTGHDHRVRNNVFKNTQDKEVLMIAGHSHGRSVASVDIVFNWTDDKEYVLTSKAGDIVSLDTYEADPEFLNRYADEMQQVEDFVSQPLGKLEKDLHSIESFKGNAAFVDFIHLVQLELTQAEVSLAAPLSYDATLKAGELSMRDMFRLYPYENYLYVMKLTGEEVRNTLEYSYGLWFNTMENADDHIFNLRKDDQGNVALSEEGRARFANAYFNFDSAAGIDYIVDVSKPIGSRVAISQMSSGEPFYSDSIYPVAVNSYRGSGGGGHLTQGAGIDHNALEERIAEVTEQDLRSHMAALIQEKKVLNPEAGNNWTIVPQAWAGKALERDFKLLFP